MGWIRLKQVHCVHSRVNEVELGSRQKHDKAAAGHALLDQ